MSHIASRPTGRVLDDGYGDAFFDAARSILGVGGNLNRSQARMYFCESQPFGGYGCGPRGYKSWR